MNFDYVEGNFRKSDDFRKLDIQVKAATTTTTTTTATKCVCESAKAFNNFPLNRKHFQIIINPFHIFKSHCCGTLPDRDRFERSLTNLWLLPFRRSAKSIVQTLKANWSRRKLAFGFSCRKFSTNRDCDSHLVMATFLPAISSTLILSRKNPYSCLFDAVSNSTCAMSKFSVALLP